MYSETMRQNGGERIFQIGIVGASRDIFNTLSRIFDITKYRTRAYKARYIPAMALEVGPDIDFIIMCTNNPHTLAHWAESRVEGDAALRPIVRISRLLTVNDDTEYVITMPINPGGVLKVLDQYTSKVLNYCPEIKIGITSQRESFNTLKMLKNLHAQRKPQRNKRISRRALVADSSPMTREQIALELELMDIDVDCFASADRAVAFAQLTAYDIIFLDIRLADRDGFTVCRKVRRSELNRNTPVILLAHKSSPIDKIKSGLAGGDLYVVKPIEHHYFVDLVLRYCMRSRAVLSC